GWRAAAHEVLPMAQGYLNDSASLDSGAMRSSVRVRISGGQAWLNIKSVEVGASRQEFDYPIPVAGARALLALCVGGSIDKRRHLVRHGGHLWEVDEFLGENAGLVVAEVELGSVDEAFERPEWLGEEGTHDTRYYTLAPATTPYPRSPRHGAIARQSAAVPRGTAWSPRMLVIGIAGTELTAQERDWLQHDACAGVILFTRNFASRAQVAELSQAIREAAPRPQLVCVDQEGGRVQRFREGYSALPPLERFGRQYRTDPQGALELAREHAWVMASEVRASGVDLSFAPVVDLGRGNRAIGDRAFDADPEVVAEFTRAYVEGMHAAGMAATLKHFPGHGSVLEDTHHDDAIDPRSLEEIQALDLVPFAAGIEAGADAVMMAHVAYPAVAPEPA